MDDVRQLFDDRRNEIDAYLAFLADVEASAQAGPPRLSSGATISVQQQRILYSGVYLHLYNLVEAIVVRCIEGVTESAIAGGAWKPSDLILQLRREWVRVMARTHVELTHEHRLEHALELCSHLMDSLTVGGFKMDKGGGGNWDDMAIEGIAARLGFQLSVSQPVYSAIKRPFRDDKGPLALVKSLRNSLAHGGISFAECGENVTVAELRDLATRTVDYLFEVVGAFTLYVDQYAFLKEDKRPVPA
jgi:hypothetical protein